MTRYRFPALLWGGLALALAGAVTGCQFTGTRHQTAEALDVRNFAPGAAKSLVAQVKHES